MAEPTVFAKRMREAREKCGLKQKELAEKIGVTPQTISAYEKNGKIPTLDNAASISQVLGVSIDWLYGLEDQGDLSAKYKTLGDIARAIVEISQRVDVSIFLETGNNIFVSPTINGRAELYFHDEAVRGFLEEWKKMRDLLYDNTIDVKLYQLWLNDKFSTMDRVNIDDR